jgi:two-component system OmpR family sensor kinase/two-component system sensor histidine kinase BaeS
MMRDSCRRDGPPWWPAGEPWPPRPRGFGVDRRARGRFFRRIAVAAVVLLVLAVSGMFAVASVVAGRFGLVGGAAAILGVFVLAAAGIMASVMFGAMRRFASPLGAVMDAADRVADGDYSVRVQEHGPPPIRALAHSFNTMTARLQHADRRRRDLMADVAHELRTPLSVLQGRLEGLLDGVYPRDDQQIAELVNDTQVLSRLIEDLRVLALSEAGALPLEKEPTDVVGLVREVVRSMQTEASRRSVALDVTTSVDNIVVDLDPLRIREVLTNLLSNALRHAAAGRAVTVSVSRTAEGAIVAVSDTGEGMPAEDVARIFDRFHKGAGSRGSGLGLTIARGIVTAHGGDISASSQLGTGTTVTFTLPRSPDEQAGRDPSHVLPVR